MVKRELLHAQQRALAAGANPKRPFFAPKMIDPVTLQAYLDSQIFASMLDDGRYGVLVSNEDGAQIQGTRPLVRQSLERLP